jgi:hypothetical protein
MRHRKGNASADVSATGARNTRNEFGDGARLPVAHHQCLTTRAALRRACEC